MQEAKVYNSLKELRAELVSDEGEECRKKRFSYNCIGNHYGIRYDSVRSGRRGKDAAPPNGGEEKKITVRAYEVIQGKVSSIGILPPDDPLFTRGVIIGGFFSRRGFQNRGESTSKK